MLKRWVMLLTCMLALFAPTVFASTQIDDPWRSYIDGTVGKPFYYLYTDLKNKFFTSKASSRALDLGVGAGNETIDLVAQNWDVLGIDTSSRSGEVISERARGLPGRFQFQLGDLSSVRLSGNYDLVISFFALPFGNKKDLLPLFNNISQHMQSGAIFAGNFFGKDHDFVKKGMAYGVSKDEVMMLLTGNRFKVVFFLNRIYDQKDFSGDQVHWDLFDVIAVKV